MSKQESPSMMEVPGVSADDHRFRWLAKNLPNISYRGCGPEEGMWLEWTDNTGKHQVRHKTGIHAEDRMRNVIDRAILQEDKV